MTIEEVMELANKVRGDRAGQWKDAYKLSCESFNLKTGESEPVGKWCARMCDLKLQRFIASDYKSVDSIVDLINYAAMALVDVEAPKKEGATNVY